MLYACSYVVLWMSGAAEKLGLSGQMCVRVCVLVCVCVCVCVCVSSNHVCHMHVVMLFC
jgi:hypothetical protein